MMASLARHGGPLEPRQGHETPRLVEIALGLLLHGPIVIREDVVIALIAHEVYAGHVPGVAEEVRYFRCQRDLPTVRVAPVEGVRCSLLRADNGIALGPQSRRAIYGGQSVSARRGHGAARKSPHATVFGGKCVSLYRACAPWRRLKRDAAAVRGGRVSPPVLGAHQQGERRPGSDRRRGNGHQLDCRPTDDRQRGRRSQRDECAAALRVHGHPEIPLGLQERLRPRAGAAPAAVAVGHHQPFAGFERAAMDHQQDRRHLLNHDGDPRRAWRLHGHVVRRRGVVELRICPVRVALRKHPDATAGGDPPLADNVRQPLSRVATRHHLAGRVEEHPPIGLPLCVRRTSLYHLDLRFGAAQAAIQAAGPSRRSIRRGWTRPVRSWTQPARQRRHPCSPERLRCPR